MEKSLRKPDRTPLRPCRASRVCQESGKTWSAPPPLFCQNTSTSLHLGVEARRGRFQLRKARGCQPHLEAWRTNSDGPVRVSASHPGPTLRGPCTSALGIHFTPTNVGVTLPLYRWKNRDSEDLTDTAPFSAPGEESCFEHRPSYPYPVLLPPRHTASLLPEKPLRQRA